jgi:outer membrane protein
MPKTKTTYAFAAGLTLAFGSIGAYAQSEDAANTLKIGYAGITFNTKSGHLIGPPGTTPPGIQADLRDARTLALIYERRISGPWSVGLCLSSCANLRHG